MLNEVCMFLVYIKLTAVKQHYGLGMGISLNTVTLNDI